MASAAGSATKAGFEKATVWATAVALGATDIIEYGSESLTTDVTLIDDTQISGSATPGGGARGNEITTGAIEGMDLQFEAISQHKMLAMAMGSDTVATEATTGKRHLLALLANTDGNFGTLAFDKQVAIHEFPNFKPMGFTIGVQSNNNFKLAITGAARKLESASATNTSSSSWTPSTLRSIATFGQAQLYMNAQSAGALDITLPSTDQVCFSEFTLSMERPMDPHVTSCTYPYIEEPTTNGFIMPTGQINFPVYTTANHPLFATGMLTKAAYKARLVIDTGTLVGAGPATYQIRINIPYLQFTTGAPNIAGPQKVPLNLGFRGANAPAEPTGFTGLGRDISIEIVNSVATQYLA